jgi:flagella basal body P-ring formation protein FlgA
MLRTLRTLVLAVVASLAAIAPAAAFDGPAPTQRVDASRIAALAATSAHKLVNAHDKSLAAVYPAVSQIVPAGALAVTALPAQMTATYISVPVQIAVDGRLERTVYVGYRVTTFIMTAVASHDIAYGSVLGTDDVQLVRTPQLAGRLAVKLDDLVGRKVMHTIPSGTPVMVDDTQVNPVVGAGQPAQYIVRDGDVAVAVDVVAKSSGGIGQTVTVLNQSTGKTLTGTVVGPGMVEYKLPGGRN